jgi:hypothetical protein
MTTQTQRERREELYGLLGDLPPRGRPVGATLVSREECQSYTLEKLVLDLNGVEAVPAYFTRPRSGSGPYPAVLYNHAHGGDYGLGKEEFLAGRSHLRLPAYAQALAEAGCCGLCIDTWAFGERQGRTESEIFKEMLWRGQVMWGMMVFDNLRAADYLLSRPEVDAGRLATLGLSMGSTMAWWTAALEERFKVCVDLCCLTDYQALLETRNLDGHGVYYYVPGLLKHFSSGDINALIAPRAHLSLNGEYDRLTPPAGLDRIDARLRQEYAALGAAEAWKLVRYQCGHMETAAMRQEIFAFLRRWL